MARTINFALVGCGRIAERHIDAIAKSQNTRLAAVCDLDQERAQEKAKLSGAPYYQSYHDMLANHPEIDIVTIITPSGMHYEQAAEIIERYQKHIMLEKPMVLRIEQAYQLKQQADKKGLKIFPIYQNRFNKAVQRVKTAMQDQTELGKLRVGTVRVRWCRPQRYYDLSPWRGTWAMDGGALTNQGIHYIDLLRYLCGEIKRVNTSLATLGANIEVEDTGVAIVEFENGALGVIEIMTSARPLDFEASVSCVCEHGLAVLGGIATNQLITFSPDPNQQSQYSEEFPTVYGFGHNKVIQDAADLLLNNKPPAIEFEDGLNSIKLLHAIYRSHELKSWVDFAEVTDSAKLGKQSEELANLYRR